MKRIQFDYRNQEDLMDHLLEIQKNFEKVQKHAMLFHIFTDGQKIERVEVIRDMIHIVFPYAQVCGAVTDANIRNGMIIRHGISLCCTIFEDPDTKVEVHAVDLDEGQNQEAGEHIVSIVRERSWVKGVELLVPLQWRSMACFLECIEQLPQDIEIFGGGAFSQNQLNQEAFVLPNTGDIRKRGAVYILYGGNDLHIRTDYILGWKPLGKKMIVTKAEGNHLYELDGAPAFSSYHRYLRVNRDEFDLDRGLEFPFLYELAGLSILRVPVRCGEDDSLDMAADIVAGSPCRLAYGDPAAILETVRQGGERLAEFRPQVINLYSCSARRTFWGRHGADKETIPFEGIGGAAGFYTSGEILRKNGRLMIHNMTIVVAVMREGSIEQEPEKQFILKNMELSRQASLISRFANFVNVAIQDLEEANRHLDHISKTDGLTNILNRREIQNRILDTFAERKPQDILTAVMIDIDNFKRINDTYGHREGDNVLRTFSARMQELIDQEEPDSFLGRWGGEEFMLFLPGIPLERASELAEKIRRLCASIRFPLAGQQTISLGVCQAGPDETADSFVSRTDSCLYKAKNSGKNRVITG